jgi:hypothetical protein
VVVTGEDDLLAVGRVSSALRQAWAGDPALQDFAFRALSTGSRASGFRSMSDPTPW